MSTKRMYNREEHICNLPQPPKRMKYAYTFFFNDEKLKIIQKYPNITPGDMAKKISKRWKCLDEKDSYLNKQLEDKERYSLEYEQYNQKLQNFFDEHPNIFDEHPNMFEYHPDMFDEDGEFIF